MQLRTLGVLGLLIGLTACSREPRVATSGPMIEASLAARWNLGNAPGRETRFSMDGKLLAAANALGPIVVRKAPKWGVAARLNHPGGPTSVAFSPDGKILFSSGYDGKVHLWDVATGAKLRSFQAAQGTIWSIDVSPDGRRLATSGEDRKVRIWPLDGRPVPVTLSGHERNVWEIRFRPDGQQVASASFDETARLWSLDGREKKPLRAHSEAVVALDYRPDGRMLATGSDDSTIRLWHSADGTAVRTILAGNHVYRLDFSHDGRWLASAGRARGGVGTFWYQLTGAGSRAKPVGIWRIDDGALVAAIPHPTDVFGISVSPDGRLLATNDDNGDLRLWRLRCSNALIRRESRGRSQPCHYRDRQYRHGTG